MLSVRQHPETEERLEALARTTGRTKSHYARQAILLHLEEMEDRCVAIQRVEEPAARVPLEDIGNELEDSSFVWSVEFDARAAKELRKVDRQDQVRIARRSDVYRA